MKIITTPIYCVGIKKSQIPSINIIRLNINNDSGVGGIPTIPTKSTHPLDFSLGIRASFRLDVEYPFLVFLQHQYLEDYRV